MEQPSIITGYDLMFSNKLVKRLLASTRTILLKYYAEADIVAVLEDLEKQGVNIETLGFQEALIEFERRPLVLLAPLAPWLTVKKKKYE
jgi:DNA polymerase I-like protein with 3'-5' exonuclease and polymerase domains